VATTRDGDGTPGAGDRLALKLAADVLAATVRGADKVGRTGEMTLAAILVGCPLDETPAFVARYLGALERVTGGGTPIDVSCGVQPLAGTSTPNEALELADAAADDGNRPPAQDFATQAAHE
jgi:GGDEF domain-containing protein